MDLVLVMTVNPGFGGQAFIERTINKISQLREWISNSDNPSIHIEVDGGITAETAPLVVEAGADVLVAAAPYSASRIARQLLQKSATA